MAAVESKVPTENTEICTSQKYFSIALVQILEIKWPAEPKLLFEEKSTAFFNKKVTQQLQIPVPEASRNVYRTHH